MAGAMSHAPRPPSPSERPPQGHEVSASELAELDQLVKLERTRAVALFVVATVALRGAQAASQGTSRAPAILPYLLALAGVVLVAYASWSMAHPEGAGQSLLRLDPAGEIVAGSEILMTVLLRPRKPMDLDPLKVRIFAQGADVGLVKGPILHESVRLLGERRAVQGGRALRFEARILIPDDAPTSAPGKPVTWRVEVGAGEPAVFAMSRLLRVRSAPLTAV
jgi:hypothetical protein